MKRLHSVNTRIVFTVSLLLSVCLLLTSCGVFTVNRYKNDEDTTSDKTNSSEETTFKELDLYTEDFSDELQLLYSYISGIDYDGGVCKIVTAGKNVLFSESDSTPVISDEYTARNESVEDELGISLVEEKTDSALMLEQILQANKSGTYYADIILIPQKQLFSFASSGAIVNLRSLPTFDYEAPFFYESSVEAGGGYEKIYGVAGPASIHPDMLSGVFFNKELIDNAGLESPYALVDRGEWTIDRFVEYASAACSENKTAYASQNTSPFLADIMYFACGGRLTNYTVGRYPQLAVGDDMSVLRMQKASSVVNMAQRASASSSIESFSEGNSVFLIERLYVMKEIANSKCDWGLLPLPKLDAEQESYCSLADWNEALFFAVPVSAPDYSLSGDVINAMNVTSYGYMRDAYLTEASYYYLRDNASIRMMQYIMDSPVYDGAYSFFEAADAVPLATFLALRSAVDGTADLKWTVESREYGFNNAMYNLFK